MQFDTSKADSVDDVGGNMPYAGRYHVVFAGATWSDKSKKPTVVAAYKVLGGTVPGQVGKECLDWMTVQDNVAPRFVRLAMCLGLIGPHEVMNVDDNLLCDFFNQAVGRDLIILLDEGTYEGKKQVKMPYSGMWPIGHAQVTDVPLGERPYQGPPASVQQAGPPPGPLPPIQHLPPQAAAAVAAAPGNGHPANYGMPIGGATQPAQQQQFQPAQAAVAHTGPAAANPWLKV